MLSPLSMVLLSRHKGGEVQGLGMQGFTKGRKVVCDRCFTEDYIYLKNDGSIRFRCRCCGSVITMKRLSNRHINKDIWSPK